MPDPIRRDPECGFSLIELVITSAIMGVISLAIVSMLNTQLNTINYLEDKIANMDLANEFSQQMLVPEVCDTTLKGISLQKAPHEIKIRGPKGKVYYSAQDQDASRYEHLEIQSIQLTNENVPDHAGSGWVQILISTKRLRKGSGPPVLRPVKARVRVLVNDTMTINGCDTGRITALDCGQFPHGKIITNYEGECPGRIRKRDICIGGIWLLYEKRTDPKCSSG